MEAYVYACKTRRTWWIIEEDFACFAEQAISLYSIPLQKEKLFGWFFGFDWF